MVLFSGLFIDPRLRDNRHKHRRPISLRRGSGSLLTDAGGYGNQVVLYNTSWTAGINGSALVFNGTTSYGSAVEPRANTLDFGSGDFTMSAWINTTSPSNQGYKENIISKGDPFNTGYKSYHRAWDSRGICRRYGSDRLQLVD